MDALLAGVDAAAARLVAPTAATDAADAIMTTDTVPKQSVARGDGFTVGGMAKGAGMLAPGLATMLVVLTTDAVADAGRPRRGAARGDRRRPSTGSTPTAACRPTTPCCCSPAARPASRPARGRAGRGRPRRLRRPRPPAGRPTPRARRKDIAHRGRATPRPRPTRVDRRARPSRAATCSSARSTARTRTGAGCSPPSARPTRLRPGPLAVAINGVWVCRDGAAGEDRGAGRPVRPRRRHHRRPRRRRRDRHGLDQRPHRRRTSTRTRRTRHEQHAERRRHAAAHEGRGPGRGAALAGARSTAGPSSSSTAATR